MPVRTCPEDQEKERRLNMSDYVLSCCSTADLSKEHFQQRDIKYICFHYFIDD